MTEELSIYPYHSENFYFIEGTEWYKREEVDKYIRAVTAEARNEGIDDLRDAALAAIVRPGADTKEWYGCSRLSAIIKRKAARLKEQPRV